MEQARARLTAELAAAGQAIRFSRKVTTIQYVGGGGGKLWRCGTPQHGLYSNKMALITSDCGAIRSLSIKWP